MLGSCLIHFSIFNFEPQDNYKGYEKYSETCQRLIQDNPVDLKKKGLVQA